MKGGSRAELAVGVFAILVLVILTFMTFRVGDFVFEKKRGYTLYAYFKNTGGLDEKSRIKIAGVEAGVVEKIKLVDGKAKVTMRIDPDVQIYSDAIAFIRATGLLGDKYLEIRSGSTLPLLKDGDTITEVHEIVDMDDLVRNISDVAMNLLDFVGELNQKEMRDNLRGTIENLRYITQDLRGTVSENQPRVNSIVQRIDHLVATLDSLAQDNRYALTNTISNINEVSAVLKTEAPALIKDLRETSAMLKDIIAKSEPTVESVSKDLSAFMGSANRIAEKIDKGQGVIGKLVNDPQLYASLTNAVNSVTTTLSKADRFRTFVRMDGSYMTRLEEAKGNFLITLQPSRPDKYYILGISSDPLGRVSVTETNTNGVIKREEKTKKSLTFTAHFAKRYNNTALRLGLTENTFGTGADQFLFNDRLKLSADAWDFGKEETDSQNPHVRVGADLFLHKNVFITGGYDNIFNTKTGGTYFGAGVRFEDEDLKYLINSIPNIPGN